MTRRRVAVAVVSATGGTALLAGAYLLMARADAPLLAMVLWGLVALAAVLAFLTRFRPERVSQAVTLAALTAGGQTLALHGALLLVLHGSAPAAGLVLRHLLAFLLLDGLTLVTATLAGQWFPHRPPSR